ncbi:hypothetical protein [Bradyrhizobium sp. ARR65]|uniref:hypothetical protein n=1 Tax=Bradyrhizobium sp. ARR65 TaxID=1040989 RepID=UPI000467CB61|nr:hypothetical protein [Bradyrhizobium sp. ARR65]
MSICRERVLTIACEYTILGLGPVGKIIAAGHHAPNRHRDVVRSRLDQKPESSPARWAAVESLLLRVNCELAAALPVALCGEAAS